jgi:uncharacterized RDD family membrane protein YckC
VITANYGERVLAYLIDIAFVLIPGLVAGIVAVVLLFEELSRPVGIVLLLAALGWLLLAGLWNEIIRQGRVAQTIGKRQRGISLVRADTGLPVGIGLAFVRVLVVWVANLFTGGLFILVDLVVPAFDDQGRRLVDRLLSTRVVRSSGVVPSPAAVPTGFAPPPSPPGWT